MAFNWEIAVKKSGEEWTPLPEEIQVRAALNGRHDEPDLTPLIVSILELGQLQPVTIRREGGLPVLFAGFNRWKAISEINRKGLTGKMRPDASVPMRVRAVVRNIDEETGFFANIAENNVRSATTELDDAHNLRRLIDGYGLTEEEAAQKYGKTVKWVRARLELVQLSKPAQKAYREGRLIGPQARKLSKMSAAQQNSILEAHGGEKITASVFASSKHKPADLKSIARAVFKGVTEEDMRCEDNEFISVRRDKLVKLYEALR